MLSKAVYRFVNTARKRLPLLKRQKSESLSLASSRSRFANRRCADGRHVLCRGECCRACEQQCEDRGNVVPACHTVLPLSISVTPIVRVLSTTSWRSSLAERPSAHGVGLGLPLMIGLLTQITKSIYERIDFTVHEHQTVLVESSGRPHLVKRLTPPTFSSANHLLFLTNRDCPENRTESTACSATRRA